MLEGNQQIIEIRIYINKMHNISLCYKRHKNAFSTQQFLILVQNIIKEKVGCTKIP